LFHWSKAHADGFDLGRQASLFRFSRPNSAKSRIFWLSHGICVRNNYRHLTGLAAPFALTLLAMALILKEPDLGTSLLLMPMLFAMLFVAGARRPSFAFDYRHGHRGQPADVEYVARLPENANLVCAAAK